MKVLPVFLSLALASCSSTVYRSYEGTTPPLRGKGGTKDVVKGIDFWREGSPPRAFKLLGTIEDDRPDKIIPMAMQDSAVAEKAKAAGGDAVILYGADSDIVGVSAIGNAYTTFSPYGTAYTNATATSVVNRHNHSRYMVIKYQ